MRIVASWFGSNGSTVYKDVAVGFFTTIVNLKSGLRLVSLRCSSQVIGRRRLNSWGSISVGRSPPQSPVRVARKKEATELALDFKRPI